MIEIVVAGLAGYRLAGLLVEDEGPFRIFARMRERLGAPEVGEVRGPFGGVLSCMRCATVWTAAACYLLFQIAPPPIEVLAAASIALLASEVSRVRDD